MYVAKTFTNTKLLKRRDVGFSKFKKKLRYVTYYFEIRLKGPYHTVRVRCLPDPYDMTKAWNVS